MRKVFVAGFLSALLLAAVPAVAQDTRGTISGTVKDAQGVIPGAAVKITNVETSVSQDVVTNGTGYFEAPLLRAGGYTINVEVSGFKTLKRSGITLAGGQQISLQLELEVGTIAETVTVTGEAPLLETQTTRIGTNFTTRQLQTLPSMSNLPILLARFAPGLLASSTVIFAGQGYVGGTSTNAVALGGVGGNEYTIDGATNNGTNRQVNATPNSDMLQEMRVESTSFSATVGHGSGVGIAMMTKAGANTPFGTINYQYWTNKLNPPNTIQAAVFATNPLQKAGYNTGKSNDAAVTYGGPLTIPGIVNGKNKLFMFVNYSYGNDDYNGKTAAFHTIPRSAAELAGDFSDLLLLPNPAQYIIYDPLTTRPDPARPGHVIRDPFPGNIIPANRITNPLYNQLIGFLPTPNYNPSSPTVAAVNNFYSANEPDPLKSHVFGGRVDYNASEKNRFFGRVSGSHFTENFGDWTLQTGNGFAQANRLRLAWSGTGTWTRVSGQTVIDTQVAANHFVESDRRLAMKQYPPSALGLPSYMDAFCQARGNFGNVPSCSMPQINVTGYTTGVSGGAASTFGNNSGVYDQSRNLQAQINVSQVRGAHTLKSGVDVRQHFRHRNDPGAVSGLFTFDNTYTRKTDDTTASNAADLGLGWAAFMLGMPTTTSADNTSQYSVTSPWVGTYAQDSWRVSDKLTLNGGFRYEWEDGSTERNNQMLTAFDPSATLSITAAAQAAYAANPIPELAASNFTALGGSVYATSPGQNGKSWAAQSMWMPRASGAYSIDDKTVLKGGYGMYFDTLNATSFAPLQTGYSQTTTNPLSVDFGQTFLLGDPKNGVSPMLDPFPLRANGTRFQPVLGASLGLDAVVGSAFTAPNPNRVHPRVQRWRLSLQRELSRNMSVEVAYNGSVGDHIDSTIRQDYLPQQYWNTGNARDITQQTLLNANVPNPYFIGNFAALQTTNPALYAQMAGNSFFTSPTVQKNRLLRADSQINQLNYNLPLGKNRAKSIEVTLDRRFANGFSANLTYTGTKFEELTTVNEFDRAPYLWQTSNNARPHRLTAAFGVELPFGRSKPLLNNGGVLSAIVGGWQLNGNYEFQPGALLVWPNLFFNGNLSDIKLKNPTIAEWFNTAAGFVTDPALAPATFQARSFPFRIDGVAGPSLNLLNLSFLRSIQMGGHRSLQLRVDMLNALNHMHYGTPTLTPTSPQFGQITTASGTTMRFVTFVVKYLF